MLPQVLPRVLLNPLFVMLLSMALPEFNAFSVEKKMANPRVARKLATLG
jgi:hypothetical protein